MVEMGSLVSMEMNRVLLPHELLHRLLQNVTTHPLVKSQSPHEKEEQNFEEL
jgi:hypothetical protein